jgi:multimeric flavodoxin WrbA
MRTTVIHGSPRPGGVSSAMATYLAYRLREKGLETREHHLARLRYRGCVGCMGCKGNSEACVLKDELEPVLESIRESDTLVVACGVFWADLPSQVKALIDRLYSFYRAEYWRYEWKSRFASRKALAFLLPQGNEDLGKYSDIAKRYGEVTWDVGFDFSQDMLVRGVEYGGAEALGSRADILGDLDRLAERIAARAKAAEAK